MPNQELMTFRNPVLNHFHQPRNVGLASAHNHSYLEDENPWGIRLLFTLRVEGGRIAEIKFKAQSCVTTVACASKLTEMVEGQAVQEALAITPQQLSVALGDIPSEKMYCCQLVVQTFRKALESKSMNSTEDFPKGDTE